MPRVYKDYEMKIVIKILGLFLVTYLAFACSTEKKSGALQKDIIYVSIEPQKFFVEQFAGDLFEVKSLLPPGASPATFEPSPVQLKELSKAKAYLRIGYIGFEKAWMDRIQSTNGQMKVYDQSLGVDFIEADHDCNHEKHGHDHHRHGTIDPHFWVSTQQMYPQIQNIKNMLVELIPDSASFFEQKHQELKVLIADTDKSIMSIFENMDNKTYMIYHPSMSYFARDYGLNQLPIEFEGKEPSGKYMTELIDKSKELNIKTIFIQKQFPDSKARAIAKELNAEIVKIDPLAYNWPQNMVFMAEQIKKSLVD